MHQLFQGAARVAAIAALTVGTGALATVPPALADVRSDIGLLCSSKSGTHEVALRIETTVPSAGTLGQPIQLGTIKVDVGLPSELVKEVSATTPGGAAASPVTSVAPSAAPSAGLGGVAEIQAAVREPDGARNAGWPAFALAAVPSHGGEAVHLTGSGVAPPVNPGSTGRLSWSVEDVDLSLVPVNTAMDGNPAELALHCAAEKQTVLGTVSVARGDEAAVPGTQNMSPRQAAATRGGLCETIPARGEDPRYGVSQDEKLQEIFHSPDPPITGVPGPGEMYCIKATGFFNIKKVGNAAPVAFENNARASTDYYAGNLIFGPNWEEIRGYFVNHTYPTQATMLGFGFMPTRAVAEAVQVGTPGKEETSPITGNLRVIKKLSPAHSVPGQTVDNDQLRASAYMRVKAGRAEVNGVPLALGDKCMTSPTVLSATGLMGNNRTGRDDYVRGQVIIAQDVTIPPFSGCGVGEDLSPILTAAVSGSGNYANLESGLWCVVNSGLHCENGGGMTPQTFTVDPGGAVTAVAHPFVLAIDTFVGKHSELRCESATMRFNMKRGHWQARFRLAKGGMSFAGCEVKDSNGVVYQVGTGATRGEATQEGPLWLNMRLDSSGKPETDVNGILLNVPVDLGEGKTCTLRLADSVETIFPFPSVVDERPAMFAGTYANGKFSLNAATVKPSVKSTCKIPGFTDFNGNFNSYVGEFAFDPVQQITVSSEMSP